MRKTTSFFHRILNRKGGGKGKSYGTGASDVGPSTPGQTSPSGPMATADTGQDANASRTDSDVTKAKDSHGWTGKFLLILAILGKT
jgi:hypothetical protein